MTLQRNLRSDEGRAFWENVDQTSEQIQNLPEWMQQALALRKKMIKLRRGASAGDQGVVGKKGEKAAREGHPA